MRTSDYDAEQSAPGRLDPLPAFENPRNLSKESHVQHVEWEPRKVSASLVIGGEEHDVSITASEELFQETDFLLPVMLLPAMRAGAEATRKSLTSASDFRTADSGHIRYMGEHLQADTRNGRDTRCYGRAGFGGCLLLWWWNRCFPHDAQTLRRDLAPDLPTPPSDRRSFGCGDQYSAGAQGGRSSGQVTR